jgi:hypothetical protein
MDQVVCHIAEMTVADVGIYVTDGGDRSGTCVVESFRYDVTTPVQNDRKDIDAVDEFFVTVIAANEDGDATIPNDLTVANDLGVTGDATVTGTCSTGPLTATATGAGEFVAKSTDTTACTMECWTQGGSGSKLGIVQEDSGLIRLKRNASTGFGAGDECVLYPTGLWTVESDDPCFGYKDDDNTDDDLVASICAQSTDTGSGTEDIDLTLSSMVGGTMKDWFTFDASDALGLFTSTLRGYTASDMEIILDADEGDFAGIRFVDQTEGGGADPGERRAYVGIDNVAGVARAQQPFVVRVWHTGTPYDVFDVRRSSTAGDPGPRAENKVAQWWVYDQTPKVGYDKLAADTGWCYVTTGDSTCNYLAYRDDATGLGTAGWEFDFDNSLGSGDDILILDGGVLALAEFGKRIRIDTDDNDEPEFAMGWMDYVGFQQTGGRAASASLTLKDHATDTMCHAQEWFVPVGTRFNQVRVEVTSAFPSSTDCDLQIVRLLDDLANVEVILDSNTQDVDWSATGIKTYTLSSDHFVESAVHYLQFGCNDSTDDSGTGALRTILDAGSYEVPTRSNATIRNSGTAGCHDLFGNLFSPSGTYAWDSWDLEDAIWVELSYTTQIDKHGYCSTTTTRYCNNDAGCPGAETCTLNCWSGGVACP